MSAPRTILYSMSAYALSFLIGVASADDAYTYPVSQSSSDGATTSSDAKDSPPAEPKRKLVMPSGNPVMRPGAIRSFSSPVSAGGATSFEENEVVVVSADISGARIAEATARSVGGNLLRRTTLDYLGIVISTFRLPPGVPPATAVQRLQALDADLIVDVNHRYHLNGTGSDVMTQAFAQRQIRWPQDTHDCGRGVVIGLADTAVNVADPALDGAQIEQRRLVSAGHQPASSAHGTAIAGLLVGSSHSHQFAGMVPAAKLIVADVFSRDGDQSVSTAENIATGLEWLAGKAVKIVNVSFSGPANQILAVAINRIQALGVQIVAAAGNDGPSATEAYPAALDNVIAVTAVDANDKIYESANAGRYIDLAAPGVDVWTIGGQRGRFSTGTSFAAPFVTAALAAGLDRSVLESEAKDLGAAGVDSTFGYGLLQIPTNFRCAQERVP